MDPVAMAIILMWIALLVAPYALLSLAGLVLWKRHRSLATMMIALGFAATFFGQVAGFIHASHEVGHYASAPLSCSFYSLLPMRYVAWCGLWAGAVGTVWHAMRATPGHNADDATFKRQSHSTDPWLKKVGYFGKWWRMRSDNRWRGP